MTAHALARTTSSSMSGIATSQTLTASDISVLGTIARSTATPSGMSMAGMATGAGADCKASVRSLAMIFQVYALFLTYYIADVLELVHDRCVLPLVNLAYPFQRYVRRIVYRRHWPCDRSRILAPSAA